MVVTISSSPKGPPVAYAYITKTNGSRAALRTAARIGLGLLAFAEMLGGLGRIQNGEFVPQRVAHSDLAWIVKLLRPAVACASVGLQTSARCIWCGFGAEASYDQADFFVGDFGWKGFFEGLEAVHA